MALQVEETETFDPSASVSRGLSCSKAAPLGRRHGVLQAWFQPILAPHQALLFHAQLIQQAWWPWMKPQGVNCAHTHSALKFGFFIHLSTQRAFIKVQIYFETATPKGKPNVLWFSLRRQLGPGKAEHQDSATRAASSLGRAPGQEPGISCSGPSPDTLSCAGPSPAIPVL